MAKKLRLLIDEGVDKPVADWIKEKYSKFKVESVHDLDLHHTTDERLVSIATQKRRILVTLDQGISASRFPICTHEGIIRIMVNPPIASKIIRVLRHFFLSGHRDRCQHAVVTLRDETFEIHDSDGKETQSYRSKKKRSRTR